MKPRFFFRDRSGSIAIEFAALGPLLLIFLLGLTDVGRLAFKNMQVQHSARAGAQYAIANGYNPSAIRAAMVGSTGSSSVTASPAPSRFCGCAGTTGVTTVACSSICPSGRAAGAYVTVSSSMPYAALFSQPLLQYPSSLTAQVTVRLP